jgi:hypothetical protein
MQYHLSLAKNQWHEAQDLRLTAKEITFIEG